MKSLISKEAKSIFGTLEKKGIVNQILYSHLWKSDIRRCIFS